MQIFTLKPYFAIILAATELAPYPPIENPVFAGGVMIGGGGERDSTVSEGGGAMATPVALFEISSASSSSGCYIKFEDMYF